MKICVYGSANDDIAPAYLAGGEALGRAMARRGHTLVFGGGGRGMMGAVARGAHEGGGEVVGVAPTFFPDGAFSPFCTAFHPTETMRERKSILERLSDAFIVTPGGIGTLDEFFEIFTLRQLARHEKKIALYNPLGCYDTLLAFLHKLTEDGFLNKRSLALLFVSDDVEAILDFLEE